MSTLSELETRVEAVEDKVETYASETAKSRGESSTALEFVRGTPSKVGLRERVQSFEDAIEHLRDREQERWQSVDSGLSRIEHNQSDLRNAIVMMNARRVHPAAVWFGLLCAFGMAMASVTIAGATLWWVFGSKIQDEYAAVMGCEHP